MIWNIYARNHLIVECVKHYWLYEYVLVTYALVSCASERPITSFTDRCSDSEEPMNYLQNVLWRLLMSEGTYIYGWVQFFLPSWESQFDHHKERIMLFSSGNIYCSMYVNEWSTRRNCLRKVRNYYREFRELYACFVLKNGGKNPGARRKGPRDHALSRKLDNSNVTDNNYEVQLCPFISVLRLATDLSPRKGIFSLNSNIWTVFTYLCGIAYEAIDQVSTRCLGLIGILHCHMYCIPSDNSI